MHELMRRVIAAMIFDVLAETVRRVEEAGAHSADAVRRAGIALVGFSAELGHEERALKQFLFERIYRHEAVLRPVRMAERFMALKTSSSRKLGL
jgi:dGTPase